MYPGGLPTNAKRHYVRYRAPAQRGQGIPATAATYAGTRVTIAASDRYDATGVFVDASEQAWFRIVEYGGFVDIVAGDTLTNIESQFDYSVIAVDEEHGWLKATLKASNRRKIG